MASGGRRSSGSFGFQEDLRHTATCKQRELPDDVGRPAGAAQARHEDVREQDIQPFAALFGNLHGICGRMSFKHGVAGSVKDFDHRLAQGSFIVCNQNGESFSRWTVANRKRCGRRDLGFRWRRLHTLKIDLKSRAGSRLCLQSNMALALAYHPINCGKGQDRFPFPPVSW